MEIEILLEVQLIFEFEILIDIEISGARQVIAGKKRLMLELKLIFVHVLLFLCLWIGGASYLFLAIFQAVPQQSSTIFYSLGSLKFVNSALISNLRIDSKIIILKRILMSLSKLRSNSRSNKLFDF